MSATAPFWRFGPHIDSSRVDRLLAVSSFESVVDRFTAAMPVRYVWEKPRDEFLAGCERVAFLLDVTEDLYDDFFNSPVGYRSQYARGVEEGLLANRHFLDAVWARLYGSAWVRGEVDLARVEASLGGHDAKVWILESEVSEQMGRYVEDILFEPWRRRSEDGAGLLAPIGTKLEVLGAWVDTEGGERRFPGKANRSAEIHETGYT